MAAGVASFIAVVKTYFVAFVSAHAQEVVDIVVAVTVELVLQVGVLSISFDAVVIFSRLNFADTSLGWISFQIKLLDL